MSGREIHDIAASVKNRLLAISRQKAENFDLILTSYALERLLYRLSSTPYKKQFILKGAMLFNIWSDQPHRPTRDIDLLGQGDSTVPNLEQAFREICECQVEEDGLQFLSQTVRSEDIREEQEYGGVRIFIDAMLGKAQIPIRIDIGFGDAITPQPEEIAFPVLLNFPAPILRSYPRETVIAEKFQAMVALGIANSRMKDFYDLWVLSQEFEFDGRTLCKAISATFTRRQTLLPLETPMALSREFYEDRIKQEQWRAFLRRGKLGAGEPSLQDVVEALKDFLIPPMQSAVSGISFDMVWAPGARWKAV